MRVLEYSTFLQLKLDLCKAIVEHLDKLSPDPKYTRTVSGLISSDHTALYKLAWGLKVETYQSKFNLPRLLDLLMKFESFELYVGNPLVVLPEDYHRVTKGDVVLELLHERFKKYFQWQVYTYRELATRWRVSYPNLCNTLATVSPVYARNKLGMSTSLNIASEHLPARFKFHKQEC